MMTLGLGASCRATVESVGRELVFPQRHRTAHPKGPEPGALAQHPKLERATFPTSPEPASSRLALVSGCLRARRSFQPVNLDAREIADRLPGVRRLVAFHADDLRPRHPRREHNAAGPFPLTMRHP